LAAGPNIATRSAGLLGWRDRLTMAAAHIVLGAASPRTRKRLRVELLRSVTRYAEQLRTEGRTTVHVRREG